MLAKIIKQPQERLFSQIELQYQCPLIETSMRLQELQDVMGLSAADSLLSLQMIYLPNPGGLIRC